MESRVQDNLEILTEVIQIAKENGLKRIKIADIEIELSDYELVQLYANKIQNGETVLTNSNNVPNSPTLGNEAKDTSLTMTDTLPFSDEDPDLYLSTF
jgi:hypothetical protein